MNTTAETDREFTLSDLKAVVAQIWSAYLDVDGTGSIKALPGTGPRAPVTAAVPMNGAFTGHLALATSTRAASLVASLMLELDLPSVHDDDVVDAVGELANIIAGNVKALLPQPTVSGLPAVTLDGDGLFSGHPIQQFWGSWADETVYIGVLREPLAARRI
jgi:chemotaxis protein CheX